MPHLDFWSALGIVCGALIALLTLVGLIWRWVVRPVWRTIKRLNEVADDLLGDRERNIPSLTERLRTQAAATAQLREALDEHLAWHRPPVNGPRPAVRPPGSGRGGHSGQGVQK